MNVRFGWKADIAITHSPSDSALMWRAPASIVLSAILGSAVATTIYTVFGWIWEGQNPITSDALRIAMIVCVTATWFTLPGAMLLAAVEFALSGRASSDRPLDGAVLVVAALTGAAIMGGLSDRHDAFFLAALGGFYGLTTALVFVVFQRRLGLRRRQPR